MANMKQAVAAAAEFVGNLFPDSQDLRLEEIVAAGPVWKVVVSFAFPRMSDPGLARIWVGSENCIFKEVEVERDSGEPLALRMWKA